MRLPSRDEATLRRPALRIVPAQATHELISSRALDMALIAAVFVGACVRLSYTLAFGFPLNDGGLFAAMTEDLQANGYLLPAFTSYNGGEIPYAYSPLPFYAAALLNDAGMSLSLVFRILPLLANVALIPAFFLLARRLLPSRVAVAAATVCVALLPRAFFWMIMGGGITRAPGLTFAVLALWAITAAYQDRSRPYVAAAAAFTALAALCHLQMAWFVVFTTPIMFVAFGRHRFGVVATIAAAAGATTLTAPWWATVISYHGLGPLIAAARASDATENMIVQLLMLQITDEPLFPAIAAAGLAGAIVSLAQRRCVLVAWFVAALLLDQRAFGTVATLPLTMLAGIAAEHVWRLMKPDDGERDPTGHPPPRWLLPAAATFAGAYLFTGAMLAGGELLTPISPGERDAMAWVAGQTPPSSRVLVITGDSWYTDRISEWFPYLADRHSVATVQGYEWVPGAFRDRLSAYLDAQSCATESAACLERWSVQHAADFDYVFVTRTGVESGGDECCSALLQSLRAHPDARIAYDGPDAFIFEWRH